MTAAVLIPLTLALLFYASSALFYLVTALVMLAAAWEWSRLMELKKISQQAVYILSVAVLLGLTWYFTDRALVVFGIFFLSFLWWVKAYVLVVAYPRWSQLWSKGRFRRAIMGWFVLVPSWLALNFIRNFAEGPQLLLYLFILIWSADTAAYFAGRAWGKHLLAPRVSPKKSWEGLLAALVSTIIISMSAMLMAKNPAPLMVAGVVLALVTILFSVVGDLTESMMKRQAGVKDSSGLLPGHGGLLDRIDSITAAAPIFALGLLVIR